jgi:pyruvate ferredoxin oxidoreductase gamma subunit
MSEKRTLIINTLKSTEEMKKDVDFKGKIYTVDATKISIDATGVNKPNLPMLGAMIKATGAISLDSVSNKTKQKFLKKIGEEKTQATIDAIKRAHDEVK